MPNRIHEVRALFGTTLNTSFTAANNAAWAAGTANVLACTDIDISGCKRVGVESAVRQRRLSGAPSNIPSVYEMPIKLDMYLGKGSSDTTPPFMATFLSKIMGGIISPPAKTDTTEAGSTETVINATAHGMSAGMAVLIDGEVRRINSTNTDDYTLNMALSSAPSDGTTIVNSHTVYWDDAATQQYIDLLGLGQHVEGQWQALAAMGGFSFTGLGHGEIPGVSLALNAGQFQIVPSGERDQLEPTQALDGEHGPAGKEHGGFYLGDYGATTRLAPASAEWAIDPGIVYESVENRYYPNAVGEWRKVSFKPTFGATILVEEDTAGLIADFDAKTAKQLIYQFGSTAENCVAIIMPKAYLDSGPNQAAMGNFSGLRIEGHSDGYNATGGLSDSNMAIHWF